MQNQFAVLVLVQAQAFLQTQEWFRLRGLVLVPLAQLQVRAEKAQVQGALLLVPLALHLV